MQHHCSVLWLNVWISSAWKSWTLSMNIKHLYSYSIYTAGTWRVYIKFYLFSGTEWVCCDIKQSIYVYKIISHYTPCYVMILIYSMLVLTLVHFKYIVILVTLLHSEGPKLYGVLAILSAIGLKLMLHVRCNFSLLHAMLWFRIISHVVIL